MILPPFDASDVLPAGDYSMTFDELRGSHLITGQGSKSSSWDETWRSSLVDNLEIMVSQLWQVGITNVFIDGSFVERKDHPNDIDGYFEVDLRYFASGQLERDLNAIDLFKVWTWRSRSRSPDANSAKWQLPMWHRYHVELYPHYPGLSSGIPDEHGHELEFPAAFRKSRIDHRPKGIVRIIKP